MPGPVNRITGWNVVMSKGIQSEVKISQVALLNGFRNLLTDEQLEFLQSVK